METLLIPLDFSSRLWTQEEREGISDVCCLTVTMAVSYKLGFPEGLPR